MTTATVGLLFSDIEGSTRLLQKLGADYAPVLLRHRELMRAAFAAHGGEEQGTEGDSFFVTFPGASDAVAAALAAQRALGQHDWPPGAPVRVRIGVHVGEIQTVAGTIVGLAVHEAARIGAAAHGGQVLVSARAAELAGPVPDEGAWRDVGHHDLKDIAGPMHLLQLDHRNLTGDFPPPRTQGAGRNNLPAQASAFIGRDSEVAEVVELLAATRLLTLTGAGGAGKSRLALRAAAEQGAAFPDGVWFVDLAPVTDDGAVSAQVVAAMGLSEDAAADLAGAIGDRRLLFLIDNCEHLVAAVCDVVDDVLHRCANVSVLATSREPLGVHGEIAWRVPSLGSDDAIALFTERARAVNARFEITDSNRGAVDEVCRRLDAIPLALELAAARLGSLSVEQLSARLDQRFRLLAGGARSAMARQRTLQATVDWSYDLLEPPAQAALRRLGVFVDGFTLEAAEVVCASDEVALVDVFEHLDQLVAKSLVVADEREGAVRYRLLETIRQYAVDRLIERGEIEAARDAHLAAVQQLAEASYRPLWYGDGGEVDALGRVDADDDNLRAGLEWALERGRAHEMTTILVQLFPWFLARARSREGLEWCDRLAATGIAAEDLGVLAFLRNVWGDNAGRGRTEADYNALDIEDGRALPNSAFPWLAPALDAFTTIARVGLGSLAADDGLREVRRIADTTIGLNPFVRGMTLQALAWAHIMAGDLDGALAVGQESLDVAIVAGMSAGISRIAINMARISIGRGDLGAAFSYAEQAISAARRTNDTGVVIRAHGVLANIYAARGELKIAREVLLSVLDVTAESSTDHELGTFHNEIAWYAFLEGDLASAQTHVDRALDLIAPDAPGLEAALHTAAEVARVKGDLTAAWATLSQAAAIAWSETVKSGMPTLVLEAQASVRHDAGDDAGAALLFGAAAAHWPAGAVRSEIDSRRVVAIVEAVREALGAEDYAVHEKTGAALDLAAARAAADAMGPPTAG